MKPRFKSWKVGEYVGIIVNKAVAGLAQVSGEAYEYWDPIWDNGIFPFRIPLEFIWVTTPDLRPPLALEIGDALRSSFGPKYGWVVLSQALLPEAQSEKIISVILKIDNNLEEVKKNIVQNI